MMHCQYYMSSEVFNILLVLRRSTDSNILLLHAGKKKKEA